MRQRIPFRLPFITIELLAIIALLDSHLKAAPSQDAPRPIPSLEARTLEPAAQNRPVQDQPAAPAQRTPLEMSAEIVARCKAATALVDLHAGGSGSATCVSADGFFVTNHHVASIAGLGQNVQLVVRPGQNNQRVLTARVIKLDEEHDLALLKAEADPSLAVISLGTDDGLIETAALVAFGYPFGQMLASGGRYPSVSVNAGAVTALRRNPEGKLAAIQLDASVNPGNSGGPAVDKNGRLLGIVQSGMQGAGLNFAIPVSVVRDFLSGPALVLRDPIVPFAVRGKPRQFEIDAYAVNHRLLDELTVELSLMDKADNPRTLSAKRAGNRFVAEGPACPSDAAPLELVLVVHKGRGKIKAKLPPDAFSIGSRKFAWPDIDSLTKDNDTWIVSLPDGERFAGQPVGLPAVSFGSGRTTQLATADRIEVRLANPPPTEVVYELKAHRGPTEFTPETGVLRITNSPKGLLPNFEEPLVRTQLSEPIVIEAVVPQTLAIGVSPNGLVWMPAPGAPAGMEDDHGRYLLLDGQKWHSEPGMPQLPILLGARDVQIQLLWARPSADAPHNPDRVSFNVQKVALADLTSVVVQNRAGDPTRVALAISFHPSKTIIPLMPPRSSPVLESHWPLDDASPTTAADIGPAGRSGQTSFAHTVPGARGNGLQLDRQNILCPEVLPVERTDSFSCSAWVKPWRAENLTIFSRMNNGLRGFDLNYAGILQAHMISSWDGIAMRVNTIERFDGSVWHHVALTYDGSSRASGLKIYLDGALATLQTTVDRLSDTIHSDFPFAIGGRERRDYYQGSVDEVRAYNRVLSADEILELYDLDRSNLSPSPGSSLEQGLVGYWPFEGSPAESLRDKSGRGHDGKPESDLGLPEIVPSDGSQAARLGGSGIVDCGFVADFDRSDPFSLGAWFKPRGEGVRTLMGTMDQIDRGLDLVFDGHIISRLISKWDSSAISIATQPTYPNDRWHHVVCTYDGSSRGAGFEIYVDGDAVPFVVAPENLTTSAKTNGYFRIGARIAKEYFNGDLDDVFVYRRALSAANAKSWFKRGRTAIQPLSADEKRGLIGFWNFEGNGAEAFQDRSGNGHHAQPDLLYGHSAIVPDGQARVARIRGIGGIDCGPAGDFERTDAFSAGGWFCWEGGSMLTMLSKLEFGSPNRGYDLEFDGDKYVAQLTSNWEEGMGNSIAVLSGSIPGTGWRHVMFTYDGKSRASGLKLYVNGELQQTTVMKDNLTKSIRIEEPFVIGSRLAGSTMRGRAGHVRLIPRELTAKEVRDLIKSDHPPVPPN